MNEFELINRLFADWNDHHSGVMQGIGDDCLVFEAAAPMVISVDTAVAGCHFPHKATPEQTAQRAFLPALSDLAAMAATPAFFTLALTLPEQLAGQWLERFARRLRTLATRYQLTLAGGDLTRGEQLTVSIGVHGQSRMPVLRSTAQTGDLVWITGYLGQAAAALPFILQSNEAAAPAAWTEAYWQPQPPVEFAQQLNGYIHSAIDVSDGLLGDAEHLARQSRCTVAIEVDKLPLDADLRETGEDGLKAALCGGDDYQLLFTAAPANTATIERLAHESATKVTAIGRIVSGQPKVHCYRNSQPMISPCSGYQHFVGVD